jgi:hypothetical protein
MRAMMVSLAGLSLLALPGCAAVGMSMVNQSAGSAASAGISHAFGGSTYRTYSVPAAEVERASIGALQDMGMTIDSVKDDEDNRVIVARAHHRKVEVVIEPVTDRATQVGVSVAEGLGIFHDSATATEIVLQTAARIGEVAQGLRTP